jgi:hypothetical protein
LIVGGALQDGCRISSKILSCRLSALGVTLGGRSCQRVNLNLLLFSVLRVVLDFVLAVLEFDFFKIRKIRARLDWP